MKVVTSYNRYTLRATSKGVKKILLIVSVKMKMRLPNFPLSLIPTPVLSN
jgi:hypothetical protein